MSDKAVVSLSGGLDSTVCLAKAVDEFGNSNVFAVSFHYGQSHKAELEAARNVALFYGVGHEIIELPKIFAGTGESSLMGEVEHPDLTYKEIEEGFGVSPTYVPYRNGNLLSMATTYAMTKNAGWVYTGVHAEDARGWAYPDCTPEFVGAMANAIYIGTYHKVRLVAPLQNMMKKDIVLAGWELAAPFHLTMSCYRGESPACGKCPTCVERVGAFRLAGLDDPINYAVDVSWDNSRYTSVGELPF